MIDIIGLEKFYGKNPILKNLSLKIEPNTFLGIVGPNGVGKTTLIETIVGVCKINKGSIYINGKKNEKEKMKIGICFQNNIFDRFFNIEQTLLHNAMYHGLSLNDAKKNTEVILKKMELFDKSKSYGNQLSGGMKKRLQIAVAMVHDPDILILDEPTAGVDLGLKEKIYSILKEFSSQKNKIIILTSHNIQEIQDLCNKVVFLKNGSISKIYVNFDENKIDLEKVYREEYM